MRKASKGSGKRERRAFGAEFKVEAVRLMRERQKLGVSVAQVGRELAVRPDLLRKWARQVEDRAGRAPSDVFPGNGKLPEAEELEIGSQLFAEKGTSRRQATEDLMWALLNTPEFMFKD